MPPGCPQKKPEMAQVGCQGQWRLEERMQEGGRLSKTEQGMDRSIGSRKKQNRGHCWHGGPGRCQSPRDRWLPTSGGGREKSGTGSRWGRGSFTCSVFLLPLRPAAAFDGARMPVPISRWLKRTQGTRTGPSRLGQAGAGWVLALQGADT